MAAQTLSYADAVDQLASACRADLAKYCSKVELGNGRLRACLDAHQNVVSPRCQQTRAMVYAFDYRGALRRSATSARSATRISKDCAARRMPMRISWNAC